MSVIKPKVSRFQILLINFTYKLQLQLGNLIYVQNCIIFGLDEFLYINFQILSRNREKSKLRFFWDSLLYIKVKPFNCVAYCITLYGALKNSILRAVRNSKSHVWQKTPLYLLDSECSAISATLGKLMGMM